MGQADDAVEEALDHVAAALQQPCPGVAQSADDATRKLGHPGKDDVGQVDDAVEEALDHVTAEGHHHPRRGVHVERLAPALQERLHDVLVDPVADLGAPLHEAHQEAEERVERDGLELLPQLVSQTGPEVRSEQHKDRAQDMAPVDHAPVDLLEPRPQATRPGGDLGPGDADVLLRLLGELLLHVRHGAEQEPDEPRGALDHAVQGADHVAGQVAEPLHDGLVPPRGDLGLEAVERGEQVDAVEGVGETALHLRDHLLDVRHPRRVDGATEIALAGHAQIAAEVASGGVDPTSPGELVRGALGLVHRGGVLLDRIDGQLERGVDVGDGRREFTLRLGERGKGLLLDTVRLLGGVAGVLDRGDRGALGVHRGCERVDLALVEVHLGARGGHAGHDLVERQRDRGVLELLDLARERVELERLLQFHDLGLLLEVLQFGGHARDRVGRRGHEILRLAAQASDLGVVHAQDVRARTGQTEVVARGGQIVDLPGDLGQGVGGRLQVVRPGVGHRELETLLRHLVREDLVLHLGQTRDVGACEVVVLLLGGVEALLYRVETALAHLQAAVHSLQGAVVGVHGALGAGDDLLLVGHPSVDALQFGRDHAARAHETVELGHGVRGVVGDDLTLLADLDLLGTQPEAGGLGPERGDVGVGGTHGARDRGTGDGELLGHGAHTGGDVLHQRGGVPRERVDVGEHLVDALGRARDRVVDAGEHLGDEVRDVGQGLGDDLDTGDEGPREDRDVAVVEELAHVVADAGEDRAEHVGDRHAAVGEDAGDRGDGQADRSSEHAQQHRADLGQDAQASLETGHEHRADLGPDTLEQAEQSRPDLGHLAGDALLDRLAGDLGPIGDGLEQTPTGEEPHKAAERAGQGSGLAADETERASHEHERLAYEGEHQDGRAEQDRQRADDRQERQGVDNELLPTRVEVRERGGELGDGLREADDQRDHRDDGLHHRVLDDDHRLLEHLRVRGQDLLDLSTVLLVDLAGILPGQRLAVVGHVLRGGGLSLQLSDQVLLDVHQLLRAGDRVGDRLDLGAVDPELAQDERRTRPLVPEGCELGGQDRDRLAVLGERLAQATGDIVQQVHTAHHLVDAEHVLAPLELARAVELGVGDSDVLDALLHAAAAELGAGEGVGGQARAEREILQRGDLRGGLVRR